MYAEFSEKSRNLSFSENFAYVLNGGSLKKIFSLVSINNYV